MLFIYTVTLLTSRKSSLHVQTNYLNTEKDELPPSTKSIQSKSSKYTFKVILFQILRAFKANHHPCQDLIDPSQPPSLVVKNKCFDLCQKPHQLWFESLLFSIFFCHLLILLSNNEESMIKALLVLINSTNCRSLNPRLLRLTKI